MALPPGAFGSAVTGKENSMKGEGCKGRLSGVSKRYSRGAPGAAATLAPGLQSRPGLFRRRERDVLVYECSQRRALLDFDVFPVLDQANGAE